MRKLICKKIKNEKGQAIVEIAFVLPLFFLLIFAIIDFGWLFYNQIGVENAARNAARVACVDYMKIGVDENGTIIQDTSLTLEDSKGTEKDERTDNDKLMINTANAVDNSMRSSSAMTITYSTDDDTNNLNEVQTPADRINGYVTIEVSCEMKVLTPVLGAFSHNMKRTLTSTSTFKVERTATTTRATTGD